MYIDNLNSNQYVDIQIYFEDKKNIQSNMNSSNLKVLNNKPSIQYTIKKNNKTSCIKKFTDFISKKNKKNKQLFLQSNVNNIEPNQYLSLPVWLDILKDNVYTSNQGLSTKTISVSQNIYQKNFDFSTKNISKKQSTIIKDTINKKDQLLNSNIKGLAQTNNNVNSETTELDNIETQIDMLLQSLTSSKQFNEKNKTTTAYKKDNNIMI